MVIALASYFVQSVFDILLYCLIGQKVKNQVKFVCSNYAWSIRLSIFLGACFVRCNLQISGHQLGGSGTSSALCSHRLRQIAGCPGRTVFPTIDGVFYVTSWLHAYLLYCSSAIQRVEKEHSN